MDKKSEAQKTALAEELRGERPTILVEHHAHRILRLPEVLRAVGLSRSQWYHLISLKKAPAPVPLGQKSRGWLECEVQSWIRERIAARDEDVAS